MALDETGVSQTPTVVRSWARRGRTPVLRHPFGWKKLSALVMLSTLGGAFLDVTPGAFRTERILVLREDHRAHGQCLDPSLEGAAAVA